MEKMFVRFLSDSDSDSDLHALCFIDIHSAAGWLIAQAEVAEWLEKTTETIGDALSSAAFKV